MNGVVVIDKAAGLTSRMVAEEVRRVLGIKKAGHTGTLDPLATGVLPVCLNEATKLVQFLALDTKDYRATLLLGVRTDTLDTDGRILSQEEPQVTRQAVEETLQSFTGKRAQVPPRYSAVKFKGKPLYAWTRQGIDVAQTPREVEIFDLRIEEIRLPEVVFTVSCSKGTYIRSLCAEMGEALGCGGCLSALRRTRCGCFDETMALSAEGLMEEEKRELYQGRVAPMVEVLPGMAAIDVDAALAERLRNGHQPDGEALSRCDIPFLDAGDVIKFTLGKKHLVAVARMLRPWGELATGGDKRQAAEILRVFDD